MAQCAADVRPFGLPLCAWQEFGTGIAPTLAGLHIDVTSAQPILEPFQNTKRVSGWTDLSLFINDQALPAGINDIDRCVIKRGFATALQTF